MYAIRSYYEEGFTVSEVGIWESHPYANLELWESRPSDAGIVVLGVHRPDGTFIGAPGKTVVTEDD